MIRLNVRLSAVTTLVFLGSVAIGLAQTKQPTIKKVPAVATDPTDGAQMYGSYCAPCHGRQGKGDGPAAVALSPRPTDLTKLATTHGGSVPAAYFKEKINGESMTPAHGSTDMPVWGPIFRKLGSDELRLHNLKTYVDSLQVR